MSEAEWSSDLCRSSRLYDISSVQAAALRLMLSTEGTKALE